MIDNSPLFALIAEEKLLKVYKVLQSTTSQKNINSSLCLSASTLIKDKTAVNFDGKYSINEDSQEYLVINDFILPDNIKSSIDNPIGVENFCPKNNKLPIIKALFIGKKVMMVNISYTFKNLETTNISHKQNTICFLIKTLLNTLINWASVSHKQLIVFMKTAN